MADVWEPWTPKVGQRVRVAISGECRVMAPTGTPQGDAGDAGHEPWEDGLTGIVLDELGGEEDDDLLIGQGHAYEVLWDHRQWYGNQWCHAAAYAAAELIPLPAAPEPAHAGGE